MLGARASIKFVILSMVRWPFLYHTAIRSVESIRIFLQETRTLLESHATIKFVVLSWFAGIFYIVLQLVSRYYCTINIYI